MSSSTARNGALAEVDREIEGRKAALRAAKEEAARRNGNEHVGREVLDLVLPDDRPADQKVSFGEKRRAAPPPAPPPKTGGVGPAKQKILDAAAALYRPGGPASPKEIAARIGANRSTVSVAICELRKQGRWPYEPGVSGRSVSRAPAPDVRPAGDAAPSPAPAPPPQPRPVEPYPGHVPNADPKEDAELLVVRRILAQLARLGTQAARRRVLAYVDDRMTEEEEP